MPDDKELDALFESTVSNKPTAKNASVDIDALFENTLKKKDQPSTSVKNGGSGDASPTLGTPSKKSGSVDPLGLIRGEYSTTPTAPSKKPETDDSILGGVKEFARTVTGSIQKGWKEGERSAKMEEAWGAKMAADISKGMSKEGLPANDEEFQRRYDQKVSELNKLSEEADQVQESESVKKYDNAQTNSEAWEAFKENPIDVVTSIVLKSASQLASNTLLSKSGDSMPGMTTMETPAPSVPLLMAEKSYKLGMSADMLGAIQESGVDIKDPEAVKQAFSDDKKMAEIQEKAQKRNIPIAMVDAVTGGIASKVAGKIINRPLGALAGLGIEAIGGGAGELAGQVNAGEAIDPRAIAEEIAGGVGSGAPNVASGMISSEQNQSPAADPSGETGTTAQTQEDAQRQGTVPVPEQAQPSAIEPTGAEPDIAEAVQEEPSDLAAGQSADQARFHAESGDLNAAVESVPDPETLIQQRNDEQPFVARVPEPEPEPTPVVAAGEQGAPEQAPADADIPSQEAEPAPEVQDGRVGKKSLATRAATGTASEPVKQAIEKHGLDYEIESRESAKKSAKDFISEVGHEAALDAVRKNQIDDASAAYVWSELIDGIGNEASKAKTPEEVQAFTEQQAELIAEFDRKARSGGRFISALDDIYRNSNFGYNAEVRIKKYKEANNGQMDPVMENSFREASAKIEELTAKIKEAEERAAKAEEELAATALSTKFKRENKKGSQNIKGKARISRGLDDLTTALGIKLSATGDKRPDVAKALSDIGIGLIEEGIATAENVTQKIKEYVKEKLGKDIDVDLHSDAIMDAINGATTESKIKVPHSLIREAVEGGNETIGDITDYVMKSMKKKYPDATERDFRDAITGYGKTSSLSQDEIDTLIRKQKRIGRTISQLEDVRNKKRPLKSGKQRDALDAEERALNKELREAMKSLPVDEATREQELKTALDAVKSRLSNRIEDLSREIETGEKAPKTKPVQYDSEAKELAAERDRLKKIRDEIFGDKDLSYEKRVDTAIKATERALAETQRRISEKDLLPKTSTKVSSPELDAIRKRLEESKSELSALQEEAGIPEKLRLERAKKYVQKQTGVLQERLKNGDFGPKKKPNPVIADTELTRLRAEKLKAQELFDVAQYEAELKNRTRAQKIKDGLLEAWGLTRALRATGEFSFILVQGGVQTLAHPMNAAVAVRTMFSHFASEARSEAWTRNLKSQEYYPRMKASKLAITEADAKMTSREELFLSGWVNHIWDFLGKPLDLISKKAYETWKKANPSKAFERAGVGYMNTMRLYRYLDGEAMLQKEGKTFESHIDDYKNMADVINTFTGRASLGPLEGYSKPLAAVFFSPRNWASTIKQTTPYAFYYLGRMHSEGDAWYKPSVAQKIALSDYMKYVGLTTSLVFMAKAIADERDDDELSVDMDPTSADFMKIKLGNTRVDPWGGRIQMIVYQARLLSDSMVKNGKSQRLGTGLASTKAGLTIDIIKNKFAPSMSILYKFMDTKLKKGENGEYVRHNFGTEYSAQDEAIANMYPIYWETIKELHQEQPSTVAGFLDFLSFIGIGTQTYVPKDSKSKTK